MIKHKYETLLFINILPAKFMTHIAKFIRFLPDITLLPTLPSTASFFDVSPLAELLMYASHVISNFVGEKQGPRKYMPSNL